MKKILLILILTPIISYTQSISQDADGFSTIVLPSANLSLDITNSVATFNYYTALFKKSAKGKPVIGLELKGEGVNGISTLFSEEKIVADASTKFLVGYQFTPKQITKNSTKLQAVIKKRQELESNINAYKNTYGSSLQTLFNNGKITQTNYNRWASLVSNSDVDDWKIIKKEIKDEDPKVKKKRDEIDILIQKIKDSLSGKNTDDINEILESEIQRLRNQQLIDKAIYVEVKNHILTTRSPNDLKSLLAFLNTKKHELEFDITELDASTKASLLNYFSDSFLDLLKQLAKLDAEITILENKTWITWNSFLYGRGGFNGVAFRLDLDNDSTKVDDRFAKKRFNGWDAEIGYNVQYKYHNFFGVSAGISYDNNLRGLEDTDYALTKVDTSITEGQTSTTSKFNAFSGDFDTFLKYSLNFDYIRSIPTKTRDDGPGDLFININPYVRHHIYENSTKLKNNTVLGLGINAFSSKKQAIAGGLFVQTNDLFGVHAKEDSTLGQRIVIGVVARFAFTGVELKEKE
ncbi:hypothetical protein [Aquimarina sp. LLG6339-5]|uniref:hypothetical protein n=1 Tax=Aquimarina sp. LLG6339-5 TaxID=3160830 RepID=UPI00386C29F1